MKNVKESLFPVFEWTPAKAVIMGGFSVDNESFQSQDQYLKYLESVSKVKKVIYFSNEENQKIIESKIDCKNIEFIDYQLNSIWIRDYAPIWLKCSNTNTFSIANFPYGANHFGKSEQDDNFSNKLSAHLNLELELDFPRKQIPFYFDGGNIFVDEDKNCFTSIREDDPPLEFRTKLLAHINCNKVIALDAIPGEGTGHVDTFIKVLPNKKVLLAKYEDEKFQVAMDSNKKKFEDLGYEVLEIEHNSSEDHFTWSYINSLIVDENVFVPQYGLEQDKSALKVYEGLGYKVQPIRAESIMKEKGSLHCITNFIY